MADKEIPDYYQRLGVSRKATADELKEAYRKNAKGNHPDLYQGLTEEERLERQERMYQINEAYLVLSDPERRKEYDRTRASRGLIEGITSLGSVSSGAWDEYLKSKGMEGRIDLRGLRVEPLDIDWKTGRVRWEKTTQQGQEKQQPLTRPGRETKKPQAPEGFSPSSGESEGGY